jgi:hypothetical protein
MMALQRRTQISSGGKLPAANQEPSPFGDKKLIELRIPTGKPGKDWRRRRNSTPRI